MADHAIHGIITTESPPFQMLEGNTVTGFSTEVVRAIFKDAGIDMPITIFPWKRAEVLLNTEHEIFYYNMIRTKVRELKYYWIADITPNDIYIWRLKSNKIKDIKNISDLKEYKVALLNRSANHLYLGENGIPEKNFLFFNENNQALKMLYNKRVDLISLNEITFTYYVNLYGYNIKDFEKVIFLDEISSNSYLVTNSHSDPKTIRVLQNSWENIKNNGVYQIIKDSYLIK